MKTRQRVTGIGGVFFRPIGPVAMSQWHKENLGIDLMPPGFSQEPRSRESGQIVLAPFSSAV